MPRVTVKLPGLLSPLVGGRSAIDVEAATVRAALDELVRVHPVLAVHLFDETDRLRRHVLCFHNETNTRWADGLSGPVAEGDVLSIIQAVSGG
jgi:molybdopterin converting factor small subunit